MNFEEAEFTLNAILAGAAGLWLAAAAFVRHVGKKCDEPVVERITLTAELPEVTKAFAQQLSNQSNETPLAKARIESISDDELHWTSGPKARFSGRLTVSPDDRRELTATIESPFGVRGARIALTLGMIWTIGIYFALRTWALPDRHDAVRGQVFQMAQAIHGLWPPFLFAYIALLVRRRLREDVRRIAHNLSFL